jgi:phage/conjugal plasmid C-4 type zinc finger TraR family protein
MAVGWAKDEAVQEQIDASIEDALASARAALPQGESATHCLECNAPIPKGRRQALPGVKLCIGCQSELDSKQRPTALYNRRGSKDSQLR